MVGHDDHRDGRLGDFHGGGRVLRRSIQGCPTLETSDAVSHLHFQGPLKGLPRGLGAPRASLRLRRLDVEDEVVGGLPGEVGLQGIVSRRWFLRRNHRRHVQLLSVNELGVVAVERHELVVSA